MFPIATPALSVAQNCHVHLQQLVRGWSTRLDCTPPSDRGLVVFIGVPSNSREADRAYVRIGKEIYRSFHFDQREVIVLCRIIVEGMIPNELQVSENTVSLLVSFVVMFPKVSHITSRVSSSITAMETVGR